MRIISTVIIVALTSSAFAADPPEIAIGPASDSRAKLDSRVEVRTAGDVSLVKLRVGLVSTSGGLPVARLSISVPINARVVGMELTQSDQAITAESMTTRDARGEFDEHRAWQVDPAILEWHGETAGHRRLLLSLAPVTETPSTVTVLLVIPHLQRLELDVSGSRRMIRGAAFARATPQDRAMAARAELVTPETSLYAGPMDPPATQDGVKRYARAYDPELRRCYADAEAHDVVLHFTIEHGHALEVALKGAPKQTAGCIADIVNRWTFREFENAIRIDYPLHFARNLP